MNLTTPCGQKMAMNEFVRHIPKCIRCAMWWTQRKAI